MIANKILNFNTNGVMSRLDDLHLLLSTHNPIIAVLTDTRLKSNNYFCMKGYSALRDDITPADRAGGVAVLIKHGTPYTVVEPVIQPVAHQYSVVTVKVKLNGQTYTLTGLYRRPQGNLPTFKALLAAAQADKRHMIVGDLNAKHPSWNNAQTAPSGVVITKTRFTVIHPNVITYRQHLVNVNEPPKVSTLDLLLTQVPHIVTKCSGLDFLTSDHRPVLYELFGTVPRPQKSNYSFHKADWKKFQSLMHENTPEYTVISDTVTLEESIRTFTKIIIQAADLSIPKFAPAPPNLRVPPKHILALIKSRHTLTNSWYRTRNPLLKPVINSLTTQIRSLMRQWKTSIWHDTLLSTHGDHRKFWKLVKTRVSKRHTVRLHSQGAVLDEAEQSEIIATHLAADSLARAAESTTAPQMTHEGNFMFVSPRQLNAILRRTKGNKSPGLDKIQYVLLRQLPRKALSYLAHLYNSCLRLRHFPQDWKHAVVFPLLKPAKSGHQPDHYRPISLLSHMSKIFEKVILKYLCDFCENEDLIPPEQAGFRSGLSTEHSLVRLQSQIVKNLHKNTATALISIDCSKAFDSVSHDILLNRLRSQDCPEQLYNILQSYLKDRTFSVRVGTSLSEIQPSPCGVPQGSVLSPTLFSIYTGHIVGQKFKNVQIAAYADDIAIFGTSLNAKRSLQLTEEVAQTIATQLKAVNISVNPAKTDALIFSFQTNKRKLPKSFQIDGTRNPLSRRIVYLGVHLDRHLTFSTHFEKKTGTVRSRYHSLKHLLISPNLSLRLKLLIYKGVLRPALLYATPLYRYLYPTTLQKLQSFQNGILRKMVFHTSLRKQKSDYLHDFLKLPRITSFIKRRHVKFFDSIRHLQNPLFNSITPPTRPERWQGSASSARLQDIFEDL